MVLVLYCQCVTGIGDVHTSVAAVAKLATAEDQVVAVLRHHLQQEEKRLSTIRRYVDSWLELGKVGISNPIAGYHLLKRVTLDYNAVLDALDSDIGWAGVRRNLTSLKDGLLLPQEEDVNGAALALVKLQDIYDLPFDDLLQGRILDAPQAPQLTASDCLRLGQQSFTNLEFELGERWTHKGLELLRRQAVLTEEDQRKMEETERVMKKRKNMRNMVELLAKDTSEEVLDQFSGMGIPGRFQKTVYSMRDGRDEVDQLEDNVRRLCRGELLQPPSVLGSLHCGYVHESSWYGLLVHYKAELVWPDPLILLFHGVISDAEIQEIKSVADPDLQTTEVHSFVTHKKMRSLARIGKTAWVPQGKNKKVDQVLGRVESMTGLSTASAEDMHVLNYGVGGHYDVHVDFFNLYSKEMKARVEGGDRMATVLFYLNDVAAGGSTVFPVVGVAVEGRRGSALYWHNLKRSGAGDYNTAHASCPVLLGEKWNRRQLRMNTNFTANMKLRTIQLLWLLGFLQCSYCSKILIIGPLGTKSHWQFFGEIAKTLADRGHQITTVTSWPMLRHANITEIDVHLDLQKEMPNTFTSRAISTVLIALPKVPSLCATALGRAEVQAIPVQDFDIIFISFSMNDCFFSLVENTTAPVVLMSANTIFSHLHDLVGNPSFPSLAPTMGVAASPPLSYPLRLYNTLAIAARLALVYILLLPGIETRCKDTGLCRPDMASLSAIAQQSSFAFINNVQSLETGVRPYVPGVIHAGGLNCRPAQPLPEYLGDWIEGSGDAGTIYFSLGSAVKPEDMPEKYRKIFVNVFARLPQRVIWKWHEDNMEDLPPNVKLGSWLPQQDILGHPKVRLFMSHGGLFSTLEATYHAVPILGFPVFADQSTNMQKSTSDGIAETIQWDDLTEDLLLNTIRKIFMSDSYQETVNRRSLVMRDQPLSPKETVIYWTEYIIRHKGALHFRSPFKDMTWYQIYNVDVWLSMLGVAVGATLLTTKALLWCCRARSVAKSLKTKKTE
ncbi:Prolyl 4-hydroxylase alpha-subunit N-terminal [Trinorchestia longiramus]|nr:Prolyl 4-hydroxylase alpha-subunit N-terminal [Trinorchestia longiramus]